MQLDDIRISIIIPAYNVEDYIEAALDSVFAQEVPAYEVIVVNDGSTDSTAEKIDDYPYRSQLTVVSTDNQGLGPARNEGLSQATGDYVYFLTPTTCLISSFWQRFFQRYMDAGCPILFSSRANLFRMAA